MRTLRYVVADVFTDRPLTGNQLAVFTDAREIEGDEGFERRQRFLDIVAIMARERRISRFAYLAQKA